MFVDEVTRDYIEGVWPTAEGDTSDAMATTAMDTPQLWPVWNRRTILIGTFWLLHCIITYYMIK